MSEVKKNIIVTLTRTDRTKNTTIGKYELTNGKKFPKTIYTLEDVERKPGEEKVWGNTAIPKGIYRLKLRKEGGKHLEYLKKYPKMHKGMIQYENVPGFEYILMHIGNFAKDTHGCTLVGLGKSVATESITQSTAAYEIVYPILANMIEADEKAKGPGVYIEVK